VILTGLEEGGLLERFLGDALARDGVSRVRLGREELRSVPGCMEDHGLDFDDAYQYAAVRHFDLEFVSFDSDFDGTSLDRLEPREALAMYEKKG
jgi:predicted nucleic acid-binding protein